MAGNSYPPLPPPARFDPSTFTDEQARHFQQAVLYLELTVQGFSFSIGSSRHCVAALRVLMSFWYISISAMIIAIYSGLPWLSKYVDPKNLALFPWWAVYVQPAPSIVAGFAH